MHSLDRDGAILLSDGVIGSKDDHFLLCRPITARLINGKMSDAIWDSQARATPDGRAPVTRARDGSLIGLRSKSVRHLRSGLN